MHFRTIVILLALMLLSAAVQPPGASRDAALRRKMRYFMRKNKDYSDLRPAFDALASKNPRKQFKNQDPKKPVQRLNSMPQRKPLLLHTSSLPSSKTRGEQALRAVLEQRVEEKKPIHEAMNAFMKNHMSGMKHDLQKAYSTSHHYHTQHLPNKPYRHGGTVEDFARWDQESTRLGNAAERHMRASVQAQGNLIRLWRAGFGPMSFLKDMKHSNLQAWAAGMPDEPHPRARET